MDCKFYVGQKVTPISDKPWYVYQTGESIGKHPEFGNVYTVRAIYLSFGGDVVLSLVEVPDPTVPDMETGGWDHKSFRPVSERGTETGMEILRKIRDGGKPSGFEEPKRKKRVAA